MGEEWWSKRGRAREVEQERWEVLKKYRKRREWME